jgi:predicted Rossmann fold nucleotide-binding protein DprA/Smf involved in DNA uptake
VDDPGQRLEVHRSNERTIIVEALASGPLSRSDLAKATGMPINNLDKLLHHMHAAGEVNRTARGIYEIAVLLPPNDRTRSGLSSIRDELAG